MGRKGQIAWNKGLKMSDEFKEKCRKGHLGKKCSKSTKKRMSMSAIGKRKPEFSIEHRRKLGVIAKKRVFSKETRKKMSDNLKGKAGRSTGFRKKNPITPLNKQIRLSSKYKLWRSSVFERDSWTCKTCGNNGCYVEAHHIKEFYKILKKYNITKAEFG